MNTLFFTLFVPIMMLLIGVTLIVIGAVQKWKEFKKSGNKKVFNLFLK